MEVLSMGWRRIYFSKSNSHPPPAFYFLIFSHTKIINFPKSQIANIPSKNITIKRKNQAKTIKRGKSKTPIPVSILAATKKINPTKNAFIF
jgi:hypothetical protein